MYKRINIKCACGCGAEIINRDIKGRLRRFISGHNSFSRIVWYNCEYCGNKFRRTFSSYKQKYCNQKCMAKAYTYNLDVEQIKNLYINQIKSSAYIAKLFNVSWSLIVRILKKNGVKLRPSGGNISRRIFSDEERLLNRRIYQHNRTNKCPELSIEILQSIYEDNIKKHGTLTCYLCLKPINFGEDSIDHIIPVSRDGTNDVKNLAVAHRTCNSSKNNKTYEEYKKLKEVLNG